MRKGSDNTRRVQGEGKRRGKHSSGAPVIHRKRPGTWCRLSSSRANSGVDAEWADRTGWGVRLEKTARLRSCPGPLTCARGFEPGTSLPEAQSSRGGEEPRGSDGRGAPGPRRRHPDRSYTPEPADGGNCDYTQTRTHARTLDATSLGACASTPKPRPAGIRSAPRHALPLTRVPRPLP